MPKSYWLFKSEPSCFSIQDLASSPQQTTCWDGVRNYQARNLIRDDMQVGDDVLYYHSGAKPPAVAGTAKIVREAYPDSTAWDPNSDHFDPKASPDNPIWQMVDIQLGVVFDTPIPLAELRQQPRLSDMVLLQRGCRLSVQPVRKSEFDVIVRMATSAQRPSGNRLKAKSATRQPARQGKAKSASAASKRKPKATRAGS